ncbi:MAG: autotransporter domain-containing protein [Desulfovibrio sp.]|uniref:autotransporter domain-containing protein n=1 Tax=Desulfovibrio sp. TaxID=885 RepID=UPI002A359DF3|nr:autotransporter domain-containing protein [Desulfovibrio sp.]MDY0260747.1 autotransporter domain-containing protein [Desulfovibrio sp.]
MLNTFGSLALAAALIFGSAGMAAAAEWDGTTDLTVGTGDELIVNKDMPLSGTLTITEGGTVTVEQGGRIFEGDTPSDGKLQVQGGTLNINGYSDSRDLQITGGTVNITGTSGNGWRQDALGGYSEKAAGSTNDATLVSGSNTTVNISSATLFAGGADASSFRQLKISDGATINLMGLSPDDSHTKDFDDAGMLFVKPKSDVATQTEPTLLITGAETTVNILRNESNKSNHGVFNTSNTSITDGATVNVQGGLLLTGYLNTPASDPSKTVTEAMFAANAGYTSVDGGGSIVVGDKGHLVLNQGMTLDIAADGALTSTGKVSIYTKNDLTNTAATLQYSGGTHTLSGTVSLGGDLKVTDAKLDLTNAKLEKFGNTAGTIAVLREQDTTSNQMARVDMTSDQLSSWLAEDGSVTVKGTNNLKARLHLGTDATLDAGSIEGGTAAKSGMLVLLEHGSIQAQNMKLTGNALDIGSAEDTRIKVNSLTLTPGEDKDFTLTSGKLYLKGEADSALNFVGSEGKGLEIATAGVLKLGDTPGETPIVGGSLNTNITSSGTVEVTNGKWVLAKGNTLNIEGGTLTIGGEKASQTATSPMPAELNIQGTLTSAAPGNGSDTGINVMQNGVLSGDASKFVTYADNDVTIATGKEIYVATGGTLRLDGLETITLTQAKKFKSIMADGSAGLINYGDAKLVAGADDKTDGNIVSDKIEGTKIVVAGEKVAYAAASDSITVGGDFGADALVVTGNAGVVAVKIDGDTTLLGNSGQLITTVDNKEANVTVAAGKNLNLGSAGVASKGGILNGNVALNAGSVLNVAAAQYTVNNIEGNSGSTGNVEISAGGGLTADNITATNVTATGGSVTADKITASSVTANGGSVSASDITATSVTANGGNLKAQNLTVSDDSSFTDGAKVNVSTLTGAANKAISVGNKTDTVGGTTLTVGDLNLNGGSLLIDPAWSQASSNVAVGAFTDSAAQPDLSINGNVGVGMNSMAAIGTTDTGWLTGQVNDATNGAGLTQNGVTAAMGLYSAQVLGSGQAIVVDGTKSTADFSSFTGNTATFANNSLLVVTAAATNAAGALDGAVTGKTLLADSARLRITDAKVGQTYKVLGANLKVDNTSYADGANGTGWTGSNFSTDSRMITGAFDAATGELTTALNSSANTFPKLDGELVKALDNAYAADQVGPGQVNSDVKGVRFLSRATNDNFIGANADLAAKTIESASRIAVAGAVPQMAMAANNAAGAAITQRTSIAQPDGNGLQSVSLNKGDGVSNKGAALWIMPLYQSQNAWGMEAGNYDLKWNGSLGGIALGGDYTFDNALRAGIAFNIGGGYAEGEGDLAKTTNSFNFWGLGAYTGWAMENFGVTADVNFTSTYNKVKQELPGAMQMHDLKSDITAYALSSGLRAEYKFNTQYVDIIPHLGVRYMYVNTDSYDVKSNGTAMRGDETEQNIWTFPIGVTFSKQVETSNGWYVKPNLDLGVLPATGDIDAKSKVRFTGTGTKAELDTRTMDYMSYTGGLGLDFGNNNLSFGLNYNIQASEHATSHGVFGTARYEF